MTLTRKGIFAEITRDPRANVLTGEKPRACNGRETRAIIFETGETGLHEYGTIRDSDEKRERERETDELHLERFLYRTLTTEMFELNLILKQ